MAVMLTGVVDHEMDDVETHEDVVRESSQLTAPDFEEANLTWKLKYDDLTNQESFVEMCRGI